MPRLRPRPASSDIEAETADDRRPTTEDRRRSKRGPCKHCFGKLASKHCLGKRMIASKHCLGKMSASKHCLGKLSASNHCLGKRSAIKHCLGKQSASNYCLGKLSTSKHCARRGEEGGRSEEDELFVFQTNITSRHTHIKSKRESCLKNRSWPTCGQDLFF